jgi:DUF4097 and DUF4098 domain-containing protein YvlB
MNRRALVINVVVILAAGLAHAEIEIHQEHSFDARANATVVVDASFHSIEVTARDGTTVDVVVDLRIKGTGSSSKNLANDLQPEFLDKGDRLIIRSTRKGHGWSWRSMSAKGSITVAMPPGMDLTINVSSGSAEILGDFGDAVIDYDASSGSLTVDGAMRELHSDLSSGSVKASVTRPLKRFSAEASSGSVRLDGGADTVNVDTSSGSIKLSGLLGGASLGASSGSISAQWDRLQPGATVKASASSGSVTLRFPADTRFNGTAKVSSGGLHSDFPAMVRGKKNLEFDSGPDAVDLAVSTSSGSVKLLEN